MYKHVTSLALATFLLAAAPVAAENPARVCVTELMDARGGSDHLSIGERVCYRQTCYTVRPSHTLESICKEATYDLMQTRLTAVSQSVATLTSRATTAEEKARTYKSSLDYYERPFETGFAIVDRSLAWGAQNGLIGWAGLLPFLILVLWALWELTPPARLARARRKSEEINYKDGRRLGRVEFGRH